MTTIKGDNVIYLGYFILGQVSPAVNQSENFDSYQCAPDEVIPLFNTETGEFKGIDKVLVCIVVRGNDNEIFFSYDFNEANSNVFEKQNTECLC